MGKKIEGLFGMGVVRHVRYIRYILIFSACINKAVLLILRFWFLAPVRRLVFPVLLFLVAFLFGFVYGLGVVFRGGVDCVEYLNVYTFSLSVIFQVDRRKRSGGE